MKFEVCKSSSEWTENLPKGKQAIAYFSTEYVQCIDFDHLNSMENAGYFFRVNGIKMTASQVRKHFNLSRYKDIPTQAEKPEIVAISPDLKPSVKVENTPKRKVRPIRCTNNNKIYTNMSACARDLGIDPAIVSYSIANGRPTKQGYSFEFVDEVIR